MPKLQFIQGGINFTLPLLCFIIEIIALMKVKNQHNSICIQAREIAWEANIFLSFISMLIVPDLILSLLAIIDFKSIVRPFGPLYQVFSVVICFGASLFLFSGITNCGNAAQDHFYSAVIMTVFAGIIHLVYMILVLIQMPKNLKWSLSSPFNQNS